MKRQLRFIALFVALMSLMSAFGVFACADSMQTGKEMFADKTYDEASASDYEKLMYRAYKFDENLLLPSEQDVFNTSDGKIRHVQGKYGMNRGQEMYASPEAVGEADWHVRDGCRVKVHAEKSGFLFVELLFLDRAEGSFGWIKSDYVVDEWSIQLSYHRSNSYGGWVF